MEELHNLLRRPNPTSQQTSHSSAHRGCSGYCSAKPTTTLRVLSSITTVTIPPFALGSWDGYRITQPCPMWAAAGLLRRKFLFGKFLETYSLAIATASFICSGSSLLLQAGMTTAIKETKMVGLFITSSDRSKP